jgi:hypothetical protein
MVTANDPRIISFYNFIQSKPKNAEGYYIGSSQNETGLLYVMGGDNPMIQVWLPADLLEYANAAAGTSGSRAVGIRVTGFSHMDRAADEILRIFSSPQTLADFINTSECDYTGTVGRRAKAVLPVANPMTSDAFWNKYDKNVLTNLVAKHGRKAVQEAYTTLTLADFEAKFNLVPTLQVV